MNERTDKELLRGYAEHGSETAFTHLVNRYIGLVYSVALRVVVDTHLAEDVTQATFAILAREARHLTERATISSWLHRTASNQAAKLVRGEVRRRAREQEAYAMQSPPRDFDSDWAQITPLLDAALNKLAEADRVVILLRFFQKKTAGEIAAELRLSEDAAQKRVTRALERLRGLLAVRGAGVSATALAALMTAQAAAAPPVGLSASVTALALAGGAAPAGITLTTLKLIAMSKLKVGAVSALVAAGVATPLIIQHQTVSRLRQENRSLREQARQANVLQVENETLSRQLADARQNQSLTQAQLSELLRLRGEVGPLRRESQELARLRAKQLADQAAATTAPPAQPPGFVSATSWANVGTDMPEAAIQTFLWAGKHGETNLVASLLRWQRDAAIPASDKLDEMFAQGLIGGTARFAGSLQGFRVHSQEGLGENEVRMNVDLTNQEGETTAHALRLVREDNQWFPVMHVWLQAQGSVRASLEVPPKFESLKQ